MTATVMFAAGALLFAAGFYVGLETGRQDARESVRLVRDAVIAMRRVGRLDTEWYDRADRVSE